MYLSSLKFIFPVAIVGNTKGKMQNKLKSGFEPLPKLGDLKQANYLTKGNLVFIYKKRKY